MLDYWRKNRRPNSCSDYNLEIKMKRFLISVLLATVAVASTPAAYARKCRGCDRQNRAYQKSAKKAQKDARNYAKQQRKAMKRAAKQQRKAMKRAQQRGLR